VQYFSRCSYESDARVYSAISVLCVPRGHKSETQSIPSQNNNNEKKKKDKILVVCNRLQYCARVSIVRSSVLMDSHIGTYLYNNTCNTYVRFTCDVDAYYILYVMFTSATVQCGKNAVQ